MGAGTVKMGARFFKRYLPSRKLMVCVHVRGDDMVDIIVHRSAKDWKAVDLLDDAIPTRSIRTGDAVEYFARNATPRPGETVVYIGRGSGMPPGGTVGIRANQLGGGQLGEIVEGGLKLDMEKVARVHHLNNGKVGEGGAHLLRSLGQITLDEVTDKATWRRFLKDNMATMPFGW